MVKGSRLWGMVALCALSGNGWVLTQVWPSTFRWPFAACLHFALIGVVGFGFAAARGEIRRTAGGRLLVLGSTGLCVFVVPAAVLELSAGSVSESTSAVLFCAVPLMTVLAAGAIGVEEMRVRGLMLPALVGLAGAALLFPVSDPGSLQRWIDFVIVLGACAVVAIASVRMHRLMQGIEDASAVATVGLASAVLLGIYSAAAGSPKLEVKLVAGEFLRCAVLDLPEVWLLLWLIREVRPERLSVRFLLVPLVTVVEGYAVERGALGARVALAFGLLGAGGVVLLLREEPDEVTGLRLR